MRGGGEHDAGELVVAELRSVSAVLCSCLAIKWGQLTCGTHVSVVVGALDGVHVVYFGFLNFSLFIFTYFVANLQKSYVELGMSKLSAPNFVGFITKCTI